MVILFDAAYPHNRSRTRRFGRGLDPRPDRLPTDADRSWWAAQTPDWHDPAGPPLDALVPPADPDDIRAAAASDRPDPDLDGGELAWLRGGVVGLDEQAAIAAAEDLIGRGYPLF